MSAVLDTRVHERLLRSALGAELRRWGSWIECHFLEHDDGWPAENFLLAFTHGRGGGIAGHRILCRDMPTDVYRTHRDWLKLPEKFGEAIWIRYVPVLRADGTIWDVPSKCKLVDMTEDQLYQRVSRAKSLLIAMMD